MCAKAPRVVVRRRAGAGQRLPVRAAVGRDLDEAEVPDRAPWRSSGRSSGPGHRAPRRCAGDADVLLFAVVAVAATSGLVKYPSPSTTQSGRPGS